VLHDVTARDAAARYDSGTSGAGTDTTASVHDTPESVMLVLASRAAVQQADGREPCLHRIVESRPASRSPARWRVLARFLAADSEPILSPNFHG